MDTDEIRRHLRRGDLVIDADFDVWLPSSVQQASARYWTQVGVATRVAAWLRGCGVSRVLDVGSGAGKFCVVAALSSDMSFTGVEQRGHLVEAARTLATRFGVSDRVRFVHGELDAVDQCKFDALYFYNPFGENIMPIKDRLDNTVELGRARFHRDIADVERLLGRMPIGTRLVTYNGYGGRIPDSFELVRANMAGFNMLRLWLKTREHDAGGYWLELHDSAATRLMGVGR